MPSHPTIIHIQPQAPTKPPEGAACNGCGICCLVEPCPLGVVLSRQRRGACSALRWQQASHQYQCGAIVTPQETLAHTLPRALRWMARPTAPLLRRLALRWIAVGVGCDSSLEPAPMAAAIMTDSLDFCADAKATTHD
jgi:hypothetical protein